MGMKGKSILICICSLIMFCSVYYSIGPVFAETVQLKDGNVLSGKIIKEDNEQIWLEITFENGKLVRKISKSDIKSREYGVSEIERTSQPGLQDKSDKQSIHFGNIIVKIPKEWKLFKTTKAAQIFLAKFKSNVDGDIATAVVIDAFSIKDAPPPHPANLEQLLELELAVYKIPPFKGVIKSGYSVISGKKMGWLVYANPYEKIELHYLYFNKDCIYNIVFTTDDRDISIYKNELDKIVSRIDF